MLNRSFRLALATLLAFLITLALFVLMYTLIASNQTKPEEGKRAKIADVVMPVRKIETKVEVKVEKPEETQEPPPDMTPPAIEDMAVDLGGPAVDFKLEMQKTEISLEGPGLTTQDGNYQPITKFQPPYPRKAQAKGIEGYCTVEYSVTKSGRTKGVKAVDCRPAGYFETASIQTASKFRYKPKIENGEPVEVYGVRNKFNFELTN